jgi:DUF2993 family protein
MVRKLVVTLILIAAILAAVDYGARLYSQRIVADQLQSSLKLASRPTVKFDGWPFIPHALSGNLDGVTVTANEFSAQVVRLTKVVVTLQDVRFSSHRLITKGYGTVFAKRGAVTAVLTQQDLDQTLHSEGIPLSVTFHGGRVTASVAGISVTVAAALDGDTLVLTPSGDGGVSARIGLPPLVRGMHYTAMKVNGGEIALSAAAKNVTLILPK